MGFLSRLFGGGPKVDLAELKKNGALILDVRNPGEFKSGHIKGSKNIPLQELNSKMKGLKKDQVIITCCMSGMRSGSAKNILKNAGFEVYNGGGWSSLKNKI
ncbi:rhodanese-like domain-containing protein [Brumimicrobium glaciale]|jgi:rhodanese-related sulfurtransferase|uniref:Rhodanese-like domain-containing protein n=1 Tax=Brumimicrobium glaciale TaxID=200475 RepID=A0A4Q4KLD2_9FLAO|nr:rhodanese-like domain-containing protein [Brumimicrobium glaciale]RYM34082.1 rhodanese-like domain-containing protein [Brumimicrobium glaciale]